MTPDKEENKEIDFEELAEGRLVLCNAYRKANQELRGLIEREGEFAEWCSANGYEFDGIEWNKYIPINNDGSFEIIETKTTEQLLEIFRSGKEGKE